MKIPLYFEGDYVRTGIIRVFRADKFLGTITAIIDTGSPVTLLSEGDALKMRIPINSLPFEKHQYGLGGGSIELRKMQNITLSIRAENDAIEKINFKEIYITKSPKENERMRTMSQGCPSILGIDFLKENKLRLFVDSSMAVAYLEKD